ncbi:alpha/beta hydrolase [SAR202 cluster bacterium AD-804-J14_MRT_500m]|nr:alpha/beta hydrolase [SAR202 cluster bacterium AD-804-J14_MRT_500m]
MPYADRHPIAKSAFLANGVKLSYYQWASDKPNLILLHPSSGYGLMWDRTAIYIDGAMQVFALDQRGHGDSDRPDGSYSAEEYAEDLYLFITQIGLGKVTIAGHSLGGRVAQVFAATHPDLTQAILLVGGPHYSNFFAERQRADAVLQGAERMRSSQTIFDSEDDAFTHFKFTRSSDSENSLRHRVRYNCRRMSDGKVETKYDNVRVAQGLAHMADDLSDYAGKVNCPVAILRGSFSTHLTCKEAQILAAFWKDVRVIEVEGDYSLELENPEGLSKAILDFGSSSGII